MLLALTFLVFILCVAVCLIDLGEATRLNLEGPTMAKIGDQPIYRIDPTNVLDQPAPVFNVQWEVVGISYIIGTVGADNGYSVVLNAVDPGPSVLKVTATTKAGATLTETIDLEAVEAPPAPDEEAVKLNLKRVA